MVPTAYGVHLLQNSLDVEGVLADDELFERAHYRQYDVGRRIARSLAHSRYPFIRFDFPKNVAKPLRPPQADFSSPVKGDSHNSRLQCSDAHVFGGEKEAAS
jgi:hypothetical protein